VRSDADIRSNQEMGQLFRLFLLSPHALSHETLVLAPQFLIPISDDASSPNHGNGSPSKVPFFEKLHA